MLQARDTSPAKGLAVSSRPVCQVGRNGAAAAQSFPCAHKIKLRWKTQKSVSYALPHDPLKVLTFCHVPWKLENFQPCLVITWRGLWESKHASFPPRLQRLAPRASEIFERFVHNYKNSKKLEVHISIQPSKTTCRRSAAMRKLWPWQ